MRCGAWGLILTLLPGSLTYVTFSVFPCSVVDKGEHQGVRSGSVSRRAAHLQELPISPDRSTGCVRSFAVLLCSRQRAHADQSVSGSVVVKAPDHSPVCGMLPCRRAPSSEYSLVLRTTAVIAREVSRHRQCSSNHLRRHDQQGLLEYALPVVLAADMDTG